MLTITKRLEFDYGHRVLGHEGKCRYAHGHHGIAEITVSAPELDAVGRVIDFSVIKERVGGWIDREWDHNFLCHDYDPLFIHLSDYGGRMPYKMQGNPTAENMAIVLFNKAVELLPQLKVISVRLWETPSSYAEYRGE